MKGIILAGVRECGSTHSQKSQAPVLLRINLKCVDILLIPAEEFVKTVH